VFVELMPLLVDRTVMLTLARLDNDSIRVIVIPERTGDKENAALATPFVITGAPQELDAELNIHLMGYVQQHQKLRTNLAAAKLQMDAADKAAQDEAARKTAERRKKLEGKSEGAGKPSSDATGEERTAPTSDAPVSSTPESTRSLFGD
jgi:PRTRC genetic system protein E